MSEVRQPIALLGWGFFFCWVPLPKELPAVAQVWALPSFKLHISGQGSSSTFVNLLLRDLNSNTGWVPLSGSRLVLLYVLLSTGPAGESQVWVLVFLDF